MEEIAQLISNVGFPIACCIVLFYNNSKFNDTYFIVSAFKVHSEVT